MSCLFRSLSYFIQDSDENAIRREICNYLATNPSILDDLSLKDVLSFEGMGSDDYVTNMRDPGTWGGAIEIKAFCELYRVAVEVRVRSTQKTILFQPSNLSSVPSRIRIEWQGCHYEPIPY